MPAIDQSKLKGNLDELSARLEEDSDFGLVWPSVKTSLVQDVEAVSSFVQYGREFEFRSDEAEARGGRGEAPSPLRYLLSGIAFCLQGFYAKASSITSVVLDGLDITLLTFMDMRGEHLVGDVPPNPQLMVVKAEVESPSPESRVLGMVDEANRRCPLSNLVSRAIPIYEQIYLNGQLIRDTVPADTSVNWDWTSPK